MSRMPVKSVSDMLTYGMMTRGVRGFPADVKSDMASRLIVTAETKHAVNGWISSTFAQKSYSTYVYGSGSITTASGGSSVIRSADADSEARVISRFPMFPRLGICYRAYFDFGNVSSSGMSTVRCGIVCPDKAEIAIAGDPYGMTLPYGCWFMHGRIPGTSTSGTGILIHTTNGLQFVAQANWNIDNLYGPTLQVNPSNVRLSLAKRLVMGIELHGNSILFGFLQDGTWIPVHMFSSEDYTDSYSSGFADGSFGSQMAVSEFIASSWVASDVASFNAFEMSFERSGGSSYGARPSNIILTPPFTVPGNGSLLVASVRNVGTGRAFIAYNTCWITGGQPLNTLYLGTTVSGGSWVSTDAGVELNLGGTVSGGRCIGAISSAINTRYPASITPEDCCGYYLSGTTRSAISSDIMSLIINNPNAAASTISFMGISISTATD
jgi:hypothetical protein